MNLDLEIDLVVAYDEKRGIGKTEDLPWDIPEDRKHFKELTTSISECSGLVNAVMMGRKTWESLIRRKVSPLKGRKNIVISRTRVNHPAVDTFGSIEEGLEMLRRIRILNKVFGIGGEQFYRAVLEMLNCRRIYATEIAGDFECDKFFPEAPDFKLIKSSRYHNYGSIRFRYAEYERK